MNVKEKLTNVKTKVKTRVVPAVISGATAISAMAITACAEAGSGSVDYSSLRDTIKSGFGEVITNCIGMAADIVPLGLGLLGLGKMWDVAKKFFNKSAG